MTRSAADRGGTTSHGPSARDGVRIPDGVAPAHTRTSVSHRGHASSQTNGTATGGRSGPAGSGKLYANVIAASRLAGASRLTDHSPGLVAVTDPPSTTRTRPARA